jgi:uncharacterized protein
MMNENNLIPLDELLLTDEVVSAYLLENPDFFTNHPELLASIRLPDQQRGVVSLVERQQQALRAKNHQLQDEITHLMTIANHNEQLFGLYSALYLRLIDCTSAIELLDCLHQATTELLSLANFKLWLNVPHELEHLSLISADCRGIFNNRLSQELFYFGRLQQSEQQRLFDDIGVGSVVLIKLCHQQQALGFIAISSHDDQHFEPNMDTLLLTQFSQLVAKLLASQIQPSAKHAILP